MPEDRSRPDGPTIRLHVGVFESESADPAPDPMLYLGGGPGENSTEATSFGFQTRIEPFLATRDYVVLDQRGTGYSRPSLDCPELDSAFKEHLDEDLTREEERSLHQQAIFECHDRLLSEGVNLAAYRSAESAADVEDLRLALGYDSWNIHGVSYGTRLALTVMRDFPDGSAQRGAGLDLSSAAEPVRGISRERASRFRHILRRLRRGSGVRRNIPVAGIGLLRHG